MLRRLLIGGFRDCKQIGSQPEKALSKMAAPCVESSSVKKYICRDAVLVKLW